MNAHAIFSRLLFHGHGGGFAFGYGNNVRVLGEYVRTRHVIPLEEAIRKMTSLPADHFRFDKRGLLKVGYAADVVIFNAATVGDTATFEKPHAFAAGVPYVLVNGIPVVRNGEHTGARPGQVLTPKVADSAILHQSECRDQRIRNETMSYSPPAAK